MPRNRLSTEYPTPETWRQVQEFLGIARFCQLWILGIAQMVKLIYEVTHRTEE